MRVDDAASVLGDVQGSREQHVVLLVDVHVGVEFDCRQSFVQRPIAGAAVSGRAVAVGGGSQQGQQLAGPIVLDDIMWIGWGQGPEGEISVPGGDAAIAGNRIRS